MKRAFEVAVGLLRKVAIPLLWLLAFVYGNAERKDRIIASKEDTNKLKEKNRKQGRHRR